MGGRLCTAQPFSSDIMDYQKRLAAEYGWPELSDEVRTKLEILQRLVEKAPDRTCRQQVLDFLQDEFGITESFDDLDIPF